MISTIAAWFLLWLFVALFFLAPKQIEPHLILRLILGPEIQFTWLDDSCSALLNSDI